MLLLYPDASARFIGIQRISADNNKVMLQANLPKAIENINNLIVNPADKQCFI